jgi:hypothetical protein
LPPVLGTEQQGVLVSKAGLAKPAQIPVTAERRLKVERHCLAGVRVRERADRPKCHHAIPVWQRDVVLQVHIDAVKVELAEVTIVERGDRDFVAASAVRIRRVVSPVE